MRIIWYKTPIDDNFSTVGVFEPAVSTLMLPENLRGTKILSDRVINRVKYF